MCQWGEREFYNEEETEKRKPGPKRKHCIKTGLDCNGCGDCGKRLDKTISPDLTVMRNLGKKTKRELGL